MYIADDGRWDVLRLQDVRPLAKEGAVYGKHTHFQPRERQHAGMYVLTSTGKDYAHQAVVAISSPILHCKCVRQLLPHLARQQHFSV